MTTENAKWIVHDMDVDKISNDPNRREKLLEFKEKVAAKYLYPPPSETYVLKSTLEKNPL